MKPPILIGSLLRFPEQRKIVRVVDLEEVHVVVSVIYDKMVLYSAPERLCLAELQSDLECNLVQRLDNDPYRPEPVFLDLEKPATEDEIKKDKRMDARRDRSLEVVLWVIDQAGTDIADTAIWRNTTAEAAERFNISHPQVVRRWLSRYWRNGMVPNALRPDYRAVGLTPASDDAAKVGRKGHRLLRGCKITTPIRRRMREFVKKRRGKRLTVKEIYHRYLCRYHKRGIDGFDAKGKPLIVFQKPSLCPSLDIFTYYFKKDREYILDLVASLGRKQFDKNFRGATGSSIATVFGPLCRVEIDFTIGSNLLVSSFRRSQILGKPVVGVAYDVYSSAVLGIIVTWERASEMQVRLLLENVMSRKVAFCEKYNVSITEEQWPVHFIPSHLVFDRGSESKYSIGDDMVQEFGFTWENLATGRPDLKPSVESNFAKMERFAKSRPGWEPQYWKRGDPKPEGETVLTKAEYTEILIMDILLHNSVPLEGRYVPAEALKVKATWTPNELLNFGVRHVGKFREEPDPVVLRRRILPPQKAKVVKKRGIVYRGLDYEHPDLEDLFAIVRAEGAEKVKVVPGPVVDSIYFRLNPKRQTEWLTCTLTNRWHQYLGLNHDEVEMLRSENDEQFAEQHKTIRDAHLNHTEGVQAVVTRATQLTIQGRQAAELGKGGFENGDKRILRAEEAEVETAAIMAEHHPSDAPSSQPTTEPFPYNVVAGGFPGLANREVAPPSASQPGPGKQPEAVEVTTADEVSSSPPRRSIKDRFKSLN